MSIILQLPPDAEKRLREQAAHAGQSVEAFLASVIQNLEPTNGEALRKYPAAKTPEQRVADWWAWIDSHPVYPVIANDSRESIYAGRGE